jgi:hypothetical protein
MEDMEKERPLSDCYFTRAGWCATGGLDLNLPIGHFSLGLGRSVRGQFMQRVFRQRPLFSGKDCLFQTMPIEPL